MKIRQFTLLLLACVPFILTAQNGDEKKVEKQNKYQVLTNGFWDNWFISAGAGAQVYLGTDDSKGAFGKRISPALDIAVGKWFTPGLGLRLEYSGLQSRGYAPYGTSYTLGDPNDKGMYRQKWNMMNLHGDIMFNLTNMFCGYKENRVYSAIPYIGFGWLRSYQDPKFNNFSGNIGLINRFRVSKAIDINLEARALVTKGNFDDQISKADAIVGITAGITYKFKQRDFKKRPVAICASQQGCGNATNELDNLRNQLKQQQAQNRQLEEELATAKNKKPEVKVEKEVVSSPRVIFFNINQATVSEKEKVNLQYLADQIKANPNKKYTITGYADNATGTKAFNQKLSQKRAQNVYDILVKDFEVKPSQLEIVAKGGTDNLYSSNALNRMVIIE